MTGQVDDVDNRPSGSVQRLNDRNCGIDESRIATVADKVCNSAASQRHFHGTQAQLSQRPQIGIRIEHCLYGLLDDEINIVLWIMPVETDRVRIGMRVRHGDDHLIEAVFPDSGANTVDVVQAKSEDVETRQGDALCAALKDCCPHEQILGDVKSCDRFSRQPLQRDG